MKKTLTMAVLVAATMSAQAQLPYDISGKIAQPAGTKVYLSLDENQTQKVDSTTLSADSLFSLKGNVGQMMRAYVSAGKTKEDIFLDGTPVTFSVGLKGGCDIKGSTQQAILEKSKSQIMMISLFKLASMLGLSKESEKRSQESLDSLVQGMNAMKTRLDSMVNAYADSINDQEAAPYFIHDYYIQFNPDYEKALSVYNNLTDKVKQCPTGKMIKAELDEMSHYVVGGVAPDFSAPTPDGKTLSLYSLRGHPVIIDFWASWCGPCLREMPNVKNIYQQYHKQGLEILGVSLDKTKDAWVKAIEKHGLDWHHVSNLKEFDDPIARQFHVNAIPKMFVLDKDGKIIAMDLRGEELANFIAKLFQK